jgi:hypothetical protein
VGNLSQTELQLYVLTDGFTSIPCFLLLRTENIKPETTKRCSILEVEYEEKRKSIITVV